jgi:hypothetical protein
MTSQRRLCSIAASCVAVEPTRGQSSMLCALNDNSSRSHNSVIVYRAAEDNRNHVRGTHLDVTDEGAVPEGFEDEVGEAQNREVLDELLPEVVVDSEDLLLTQMSLQVLVQLPAALQVFTEGFLHDDTRPAGSAPHSHTSSPHLTDSVLRFLCK